MPGLPIIDDIITATLAADCSRLAALVRGYERPCEAASGMGFSQWIECAVGAPLGSPTKVFYTGACGGNEWNVEPSEVNRSTAFFINDITGFAGVLKVRPAADVAGGDYFVAFNSPRYGIHVAAVDSNGIVGYFAAGCSVPDPVTLQGIVTKYQGKADLLFTP